MRQRSGKIEVLFGQRAWKCGESGRMRAKTPAVYLPGFASLYYKSEYRGSTVLFSEF